MDEEPKKKMLDYTIELIGLAVSNSHAVFCFCNLIIAILLLGGSNPSSQSEDTKPNHVFRNIIVNDENFKKVTVFSCVKAQNASLKAEEENVISVSLDIINRDDKEDEKEEADEDKHENDELRKRVEDFIEKINRGWTDDEKMTTCSSGQ